MQIQFTFTDPYFLLTLFLAGVTACLTAAALGAPVLALAGESLAKPRKSTFYDKAGKQAAGMGFRLTLCILAAVLGGVGYLVYALSDPASLLAWLQQTQIAWAAAAALGAHTLFAALHLSTWKALKKKKPAHKLLGALSVLAAVAVGAGLLAAGRATFHSLANYPMLSPVGYSLADLFCLHAYSPLLPLATQSVLLALTAGGGVLCVYLLLRRTSEDYGRDYYVFAMGYAARWACVPALLQLAPLGWLAWLLMQRLGDSPQLQPALYFLGGAGLAVLMAAVLWLAVARSKTPLRHKPAVILALLLLLLAIAAEGYPLTQALKAMPQPSATFTITNVEQLPL